MAQRKWETIFGGMQAFSAVAVALLAFWAFFFSSLSQKLEESLRTEATLAKQDLVAAREAKAAVDAERDRLLAARESLRAELTSLEQERAAYAQSTKSLSHSRYFVMAKYELEMMHKISEICAQYGQYSKWLAKRREFTKLEKQWETLSFAEQYDPKLAINRRMEALREDKFDDYKMWFGVPSPPTLTPSDKQVVLTAHFAKLLNAMDDHEAFNSYVIPWLLNQISVPRGARSQTAASFLEQTKRYEFLNQLLPKEREELDSQIDNFLKSDARFKSLQINVSLETREPSAKEIIVAGEAALPNITRFQQEFLAYLQTTGIGGSAVRGGKAE